MNEGPLFLVVDDDARQRALIARLLETGFPGASTVETADPARALEIAAGLQPSLVVLDWVIPRRSSGPSLCRALKSNPLTRPIPVILCSGLRTGLGSRCQSLRHGADAFLPKPFTRRELLGYAQALIARGRRRPCSPFRLGNLALRRPERRAWWRGRPLPELPPTLFDLLWFLAKRSPNPVATRELVRRVWGNNVRDSHVSVAVTRLRRRLRRLPSLRIEPVKRAGYRLVTA